jgi:hypothetical protein
MRYFIQLSFILIVCFGCDLDQDKALSEEKEKSDLPTNSVDGVSIELSLPHGDSLKYFGLCQYENPVDVIIRNNSNEMKFFYENWNSWGYYNFHFEIETEDSVYQIRKTRHVWWRNFPSYHSVNPNESLVFHFNLIDSSCFEHDSKIERIRGLKQWIGFPNKEYQHAKIKVIYELQKEYATLLNQGFRFRNLVENDTTIIFSKKLVSKPVNIQILQ